MLFLVDLQTPTRGAYTLGFIDALDKKTAQQKIFNGLVAGGMPQEKIGLQVTDHSTLHIGLHTISIVRITELSTAKFSALVALLDDKS